MVGFSFEDIDSSSRRFNAIMASIVALMVLAGIIGAPATHLEVNGVGSMFIAVLVAFGAMLPLPAYWHQKGNFERRDAVLVLYWTVLFKVALSCPIAVAARSRLPLMDSFFHFIDQSCGVSVPALIAWAHSSKWLDALSSATYFSLIPLLVLAIVVPPLAGKRLAAQRFLLANAIAFAIGIPLFALFPVKGPWFGWHYGATATQAYVTQVRLAFRHNGSFQLTPHSDLGIISFPSFHVFWAIVSAWVLGQFRWLKVPLAVLAFMICISTMTTGYHYFADVLAGAVIAAIALILVHIILRPDSHNVQTRTVGSSSETQGEADFASNIAPQDEDAELVQ